MSAPAHCVFGSRALASRPPRGSSAKLFTSIFAIRPTALQQREISSRSNKPSAGTRSLIRPQTLSLQPHVSQVTAIARYASHVAAEPRDDGAELPTSPPFSAGKYENLTIGVPKESYPGERRVAITPQNVALLLKKGFSKILVEKGAGVEAQFTDEAYELAGAKTVDKRKLISCSRFDHLALMELIARSMPSARVLL
jgi:NAD(P) transhydrogenase